MFLGRCSIRMVWKHAIQWQVEGPGDTESNLVSVAVKDGGWQVRPLSIAREEIRAKEQLQAFAVQSRVSRGMTWQMNHNPTQRLRLAIASAILSTLNIQTA